MNIPYPVRWVSNHTAHYLNNCGEQRRWLLLYGPLLVMPLLLVNIALQPANFSPNANALEQLHARILGGAQEQILGARDHLPEVHIGMKVNTDQTLSVLESITVSVRDRELHGFQRLLPKKFIGNDNTERTLSFAVQYASITIGKKSYPVKYSLSGVDDGYLLTLGTTSPAGSASESKAASLATLEKEPHLAPGEYVYTVRYKISGLSFNPSELYLPWEIWRVPNHADALLPREISGSITAPKGTPEEGLLLESKTGATKRSTLRSDLQIEQQQHGEQLSWHFRREAQLDPGEAIFVLLHHQ